MRTSWIAFALAILLMLCITGCGAPAPVVLINYPSADTGADMVDRGFYITSYPGTTLSRVTLYFSSNTTETYNMQLQAMDSAYNGTVIGLATSSFSGSTSSTDLKTVVFDFSNAAVTKGHVVAFKMTPSGGSGYVYFSTDGNYGGATPIVEETEGTTTPPPLNTDRRLGIAIIVEGRQ